MISFASATGNLMNRLGKCGLVLSQVRSYQTSQNTNMTNVTTGLTAQLNGEPDIQAALGSSYLGILTSPENAGQTVRNIATAIVNRMVFRDNPLINQTLTSQNTLASLKEIIRQMKIAGATVLAMTVTATPGSFTGTGNGIINTSVRRPLDGLVLENSFAETITLTCNGDSYSGGATAGNEPFLITGQGSQSDVFAFNWPLGSNASTSLNAIDGNADNTSGNLLTNSGFTDFTSNVPDNWTLVTGTAGTNIAQETTIVYDNTGSSLRIIGDGSTLTTIRQQFNLSTGTSGTLDTLTQYSFNIFARRDGTAPAAGVLTIDLVDSNGTVLLDANNVSNSFTIALTGLTTNFASYTGVFRTPAILPSTVYLRMRLTTALTNGRSVYLDRASFGEMTQLQTSGPYLAVHAGSVPFLTNDYATVAITNSRGSGGTLDTFQTLLSRLFFSDVMGNELLFPSSSTPTISDSALIA